jgi:putative membrane protein
MLSSILALVAGIITGTFTGLTPGVHINLVASIVAGSAALLNRHLSTFDIGVFLLSMSITHTFLDNIPAVFMGVAEGGELLSLLPSQRMVLRGEGMKAVTLLTIGSIGCLLLGIAMVPAFLQWFPWLYTTTKPWTWLLLLLILVWMVVRDREPNKLFWSSIVVLSAGTLGLLVLRCVRLEDPLLPMLSGLFGASALIHALITSTQLPAQTPACEISVSKTQAFKSFVFGTLAGGIISLLPGLGPAQGAIAARTLLRKIDEEAFLVLTGGINTVNMALSLVTMSTLGFSRNGSLEVMLSIVKRPDALMLAKYAGLTLVVGGIATILTLKLGCKVSWLLERIDYRKTSTAVLCLVALLVLLRSGWIGLAVLIVSTATGLVAILSGAPRHHLMACIMVPVIWSTF